MGKLGHFGPLSSFGLVPRFSDIAFRGVRDLDNSPLVPMHAGGAECEECSRTRTLLNCGLKRWTSADGPARLASNLSPRVPWSPPLDEGGESCFVSNSDTGGDRRSRWALDRLRLPLELLC